MKRYNNLYQQIISIENLQLADINARKGKSDQLSIKEHDENSVENLKYLHFLLKNKLYVTSSYSTFTIKDPKERVIYKLPYYPDRIVQHAIMNILEPLFVKVFTTDTYSCIKGRGIHQASEKLKKVLLKDIPNTTFYLQIDVRKFYPTVNHDILKKLLRRKFKDKDLLDLLDNVIDSADGLPIGNYLSQYFANFYITYFDHWIKENQSVLNYFRYADDMLFLSNSKKFLHSLLHKIKEYFQVNLKLSIKSNYRVAPVWCGINMFGYIFFRTHTRVRKIIKQNFARMLKYRPNKASISSYLGWLKHGNCINLTNKLLYNVSRS